MKGRSLNQGSETLTANTVRQLGRYDAVKGVYYCKSELKERGWTDAAISKFLGEADATKSNPYASSQPPMRLWDISKVENAEETPSFQQWLEASKTRKGKASERMKKRMDSEREKTYEWVSRIKIKIPKMSEDKLFEAACEHYVDQKEYFLTTRGRDFEFVNRPNPQGCDRSLLERITVNYLRHECTKYDEILDQSFGKVGVKQAKELMRARVFEEIAKTYPSLAEECKRQKANKETLETP